MEQLEVLAFWSVVRQEAKVRSLTALGLHDQRRRGLMGIGFAVTALVDLVIYCAGGTLWWVYLLVFLSPAVIAWLRYCYLFRYETRAIPAERDRDSVSKILDLNRKLEPDLELWFDGEEHDSSCVDIRPGNWGFLVGVLVRGKEPVEAEVFLLRIRDQDAGWADTGGVSEQLHAVTPVALRPKNRTQSPVLASPLAPGSAPTTFFDVVSFVKRDGPGSMARIELAGDPGVLIEERQRYLPIGNYELILRAQGGGLYSKQVKFLLDVQEQVMHFDTEEHARLMEEMEAVPE